MVERPHLVKAAAQRGNRVLLRAEGPSRAGSAAAAARRPHSRRRRPHSAYPPRRWPAAGGAPRPAHAGREIPVCVGTQRLRHCSYLSHTRPRSRRSSAVADARSKSSRRFIAVPPDSACDRAGHRPRRARGAARGCPPRRCARPARRRCGWPCRMVESRWAMMRVVRPMLSWSKARWMRRLGDAVQRGGGLVENEDGRVFQKDAGDGDALLLSAGEERSALADIGVEAVGHGHGCPRSSSALRGGLLDLGVGGVGAAVADVLADRIGEEKDVLLDDADVLRRRARWRDAAHVEPIERDASRPMTS